MGDLNPTAASLLGFLHRGPLTGWDLAQVAELTIGPFWSLTRSQVYRELTRLDAAGLVTAGDPGPRERRPFELTAAGRDAFARWASRPPAEENIRFPLLLVVALGAEIEDAVLADHLDRHRRIHADRLAAYEQGWEASAGGDADPYARATLAFGLGYERAVLAWFDALPALLGPAFAPRDQAATAPKASPPSTNHGS